MTGHPTASASADDEIIGLIYEASVFPTVWTEVLDQLTRLTEGYGAALVSVRPSEPARFVATDSYRPTYDRYQQTLGNYRNVRPERALAMHHLGFLPDVFLCTEEELEADPIYNDLLFPFGIGWTIGAPMPSPTGDVAYFDLCRRKTDQPFGQKEATLLDGYRPHLARSVLLATRLRLKQAEAAAETLSAIGLPGGVLTSSGKVLAANDLLSGLRNSIEVGAFDRLKLADTRADALLRAALASADVSTLIGSIPIARTFDRSPMVLHLVPIFRRAHDIFNGATCIFVVTPVELPTGPLTGLLAALFDLSPAEAKLARKISEGKSLKAIADESRISVETVRTQLKSVFLKTGTGRQVELARLLAAVSPLGNRA